MIYKVRAKYKKERASKFFERLTDGTISSQKPDGKEIVSSMKRAKIIEPGIVEWFEMCFAVPHFSMKGQLFMIFICPT